MTNNKKRESRGSNIIKMFYIDMCLKPYIYMFYPVKVLRLQIEFANKSNYSAESET